MESATALTGLVVPREGAVPAGPLLEIRGLVKRFPGADRPAVDGVSLTLREGELTAILGPNGCGKSTLLRCAARLVDPTEGSVRLQGVDLVPLRGSQLRRTRLPIGIVFQKPNLVARRSALYNAASGGIGRHPGVRSLIGLLPRTQLEAGAAALERVGVLGAAHQRADTLSGGQAQRVSIARCVCQRPRVLLADEPVASLDPDATEEVMLLLRRLATEERLAVGVVLHQPELARWHAHRVVGMRAGRITFDRPVAEVDDADVARLYRGSRG